MRTPVTSPGLLVAVAFLIGAVFLADILLPIGVVVWVFYIAPLALTVMSPVPALPLGTAALAAVLIALGYFGSIGVVEGLDPIVGVINRLFGAVALLSVGALGRLVILNRLGTERQTWIRASQATLAERMQGDFNVDALSRRVIETLASVTGAAAGALFAREEDGAFIRRGAYALEPSLHHGDRVEPGQGLVGQAAQSGGILHLPEVPAGYIAIASGTGHSGPGEVVVAPAKAGPQVVGVTELAFVGAMPDQVRELLEATSDAVAVALRSAFYRERLQTLLVQTQEQAGRLQTQQEELRVTNEELEEQARALRESQQRLEAQQSDLEEVNTQLEQQTSQLEQQKSALTQSEASLAQKAEELERANRYKSEFLANMSHELRTPLNSSLILARMLADNQKGNLSADQVKAAETIFSAGNDLLALINDILDLSKIESGRVDLRIEAVDLRAIFDRLEVTFGPMAADKQLALELELAPGAPGQIRTDGQRLEQVLRNLVSNAVKFTDAGRVRVTATPSGEGLVEFAVTDTGIGIPPDKLHVIFEAFRQADGTTSRKFGGTGLGLSISRELAALLGGEIKVASTPGQGSTFTVSVATNLDSRARTRREGTSRERAAATAAPVPQPPAPLAAAAAPASEAPHAARGAETAGGRTILVVEDDVTFAGIVRDTARDLGFDALVATTAQTMWDLLARHTPEGIVLDIGLPDASGLTVLEQLKRDPRTRHIPVHVCSAHDFAHAALERGAVGYAVKPVRREDLQDALERIDRKASQTEHHVLLVEDDPRQQEALAQLLEGDGVRITAVATAAEALAELRARTFDVVVSDLGLPDISGLQLLEQMAADEDLSFPPVIVYTGRDLTPEEEQHLRRYSRSIIIKGAKSPDRLLDEVTLFMHHVEAQLPPERRHMLQAARARDERLEGRRVLLVEDDVRNIFALTSVLEPAGLRVEIARNGREALEALERGRFDLVLMDVMMPEMDGLTATREIRRRPELAKLPVIAITAKAMEHDRRACLDAGANDYIAKPIDIEKLLSLMRVWLSRQ
jgi:CheY-like chemotaxis protein/signal transduction histidine kinase